MIVFDMYAISAGKSHLKRLSGTTFAYPGQRPGGRLCSFLIGRTNQSSLWQLLVISVRLQRPLKPTYYFL